MSDKVRLERQELERIEAFAIEARKALADQLQIAFGDKAAYALVAAVGVLAASVFVPGASPEMHDDVAHIINQVLRQHGWRVARETVH